MLYCNIVKVLTVRPYIKITKQWKTDTLLIFSILCPILPVYYLQQFPVINCMHPSIFTINSIAIILPIIGSKYQLTFEGIRQIDSQLRYL